jgi:hypothetical protein
MHMPFMALAAAAPVPRDLPLPQSLFPHEPGAGKPTSVRDGDGDGEGVGGGERLRGKSCGARVLGRGDGDAGAARCSETGRAVARLEEQDKECTHGRGRTSPHASCASGSAWSDDPRALPPCP